MILSPSHPTTYVIPFNSRFSSINNMFICKSLHSLLFLVLFAIFFFLVQLKQELFHMAHSQNSFPQWYTTFATFRNNPHTGIQPFPLYGTQPGLLYYGTQPFSFSFYSTHTAKKKVFLHWYTTFTTFGKDPHTGT